MSSYQTVYPRECGAAGPADPPRVLARGLSPRVRGSHNDSAATFQPLGSIPASAGQPSARGAGSRPSPVYPRECGAAEAGADSQGDVHGLSPRVRGSPGAAQRRTRSPRSIPASAGQPSSRVAPGESGPVYPRECGAAGFPRRRRPVPSGLSPRVRGSPCSLPFAAQRSGSIPASAGQPSTGVPPSWWCWVYPRECGAATGGQSRRSAAWGLSPRVRGSRILSADQQPRIRSIPASAGQPACRCRPVSVGWVYPRECGAAGLLFRERMTRQGLSPRVRGSPASGIGDSTATGSIPASAGQPASAPTRCHTGPVYPRECGAAC